MNKTFPKVPLVESKDEIVAQITLERSIALELITSDFASNGTGDTEYFPPEGNELNSYISSNRTSNANQPNALDVQPVNPILRTIIIDDGNSVVTTLQDIIHLFDKKSISLKEAENLIHQFISKEMLQPPSGSPRFLLYQKVIGFRPPRESARFCVFCTFLGLPKMYCSSHTFKDDRNIVICPLYPGDARLIKLDYLIQTIVTIIEKQKSIKFCGYCKDAGKSREVYMSHIEKLPGGLIICPTELAFLGF